MPYLNDDKSKILLYTRNGGGNRESYFYIFDILRKHPNYIRDYDDDFDSTYAYIEFSIPDQYKELIKELPGESQSPSEKFQNMLSDLQGNKDTPETRAAMELGKKIFGEIESGESKVIAINTDGTVESKPLNQ